MNRRMIARFVSVCTLFSVLLCPALAQSVSSSTLNITTDAASATVHTVVHVTASIQTSGAPAGSITFLDGTQVIASVPLNVQGVAVLGVASLTPGTHTLSATYPGDGTHMAAASGTVAVAITGLAAPFSTSAAQTSIYANQPVSLTATGLPAAATGSVSFLDSSASIGTASIPGTSTAVYQAFGDGITSGQTVSQAQSYPSLFAAEEGFAATNFGVFDSVACDLLPSAILANGLGPTQTSAPLSSVMIGSTDMDTYGSSYLALFTTCDQAAVVWLAIPREYKVLAGDPGATVLSGSWTVDASSALRNTTGSGALSFGITSNGGPVYLWYLLGDALTGSFTVSIDGMAGTTSYTTQPTPAIGSMTQSSSIGFALLRLPLSAGPHVVEVDMQSGTAGILGVATRPSPGEASVQPTVLVSDIPNQLSTAPVALPGQIAAYTQAIQSSVTQFEDDGLDVRLVATQQTMLGTAAEMSDSLDPNSLGHSHLAEAFESVFASGSTTPYANFTGSSPTASVSFSAPGAHTIIGAYSGDGTYASGSSSSVTVNVLPQTVSFTSLATQTTRYPSGSPVVLTATVMPVSATGTVTFYDGTALLSQATLTGGSAVVTTATLSLGLHQLTAVYNGDAPDASSASPALSVKITPGATSMMLSPTSATASYGGLAQLVATLTPTTAMGTVTFQDSVSGTVGQATIAGGAATMDASSLAVGTHTLTASYSGDSSHQACFSAEITITITALSTTTTLAVQPAQIIFGAATSLTATISPASAGGSVVFRDAVSGVLGTATVTGGSAVLNTSALPAGLRNISAVYTGDAIHASSVSTLATVSVSVAASSVTLAPFPANLDAGTPLTLTATVTPATATGTLLFRDAAAGVLGQGTIHQGTASLLLSSLPAGSYSITAQYPGDANYSGSSSGAGLTQVVLQPSQAALAVNAASVPYATALSFSASVSPAAASGIMALYDGANLVGQAPLVNGAAVFKIATLATGSHQLHVTYGGDAVYAGSTSAATSASVTPASTGTTLSLAEVDVPLGGMIVFNVRVTTASGSVPGGTVVLRANGTVLASGSLANASSGAGYATLSVASAALGFGTFGVVASYSGDGNDLSSDTSATPVWVSVVSSTTTTSLSLSSSQVPPQTAVTLTASVRNPSPVVSTGTMAFLMNGTVFATVPLDATGAATTKLAAQPVGSYTLSAQYVPSSFWAGSASGPQALTVTLPVTLVLAPNAVNLTSGASTTVTLGVTPLSGFSGAVQAACTSSAPFLTCSIDPLTSITGLVNRPVHLTVAQNTLRAFLPKTRDVFLRDSGFLACMVPLFLRRRRRSRSGRLGMLGLCAMTLLSGCATGGDFGAIPSGRQLVVVSVTAAGTTTTAGVAVEVGP